MSFVTETEHKLRSLMNSIYDEAKIKSLPADAGIKELYTDPIGEDNLIVEAKEKNRMTTMWRVEKLDNHGNFCIIFSDNQKMFYNDYTVDHKHLNKNARIYSELLKN